MNHRFELFFDYASPFAYLASTQAPRIAEEAKVPLALRPFLLGALFKSIGTPLVPVATYPEAKRRYVLRDLHRWAERWGVDFRFPSGFPLRTVDALRLTLLAPEERRVPLMEAIMRRLWAENAAADDATLRAACEEAGVDADLLGRVSSSEAKQALRENTGEALARGVCGAPTFFVDDEMFWGQDRLDFVREALASNARPAS